MDYSI